MKKFWIFILVFSIVAALPYLLIPNIIIVNSSNVVHTKPSAVLRYLHDDSKWSQWFPAKESVGDIFVYNNIKYEPGKDAYSSKEIHIVNSSIKYHSILNVLPIGFDSTGIQWQFKISTSKNPITRINQYQNAKQVWNQMGTLLKNLETSISNAKNIYGFDINYITLTDTALVSISTIIKQYPDTRTIYKMINKLQSYITSQHASVHNYPMLNITTLKDSGYKLMVGVPTNIPLKGNDEIFSKRMIMIKDRTLITDVKGGVNEVQKAFTAIKYFMADNQYKSPVIPFQQLITNRNEQPDSTKWITKIFAPFN